MKRFALISNGQEDHHDQDCNEHESQRVNDQAVRVRAITAIAAIILQVRQRPPEERSVCKAESSLHKLNTNSGFQTRAGFKSSSLALDG